LETHVVFFVAAVVAGLINSLAGGGLIGGYLGGDAYRQGEPHNSARGRHYHRVRAGGILLLDPLRPVGTHIIGE
jgi:hypothetical protein